MKAGAEGAVGVVEGVASGPEGVAGAVAGVDDRNLEANAKSHLECSMDVIDINLLQSLLVFCQGICLRCRPKCSLQPVSLLAILALHPTLSIP